MIMGRTFRPLLKLAAKWIIEDSNRRRRIKENKAALMSVATKNKVKNL
jgi:hypothetical protein